MHEVYRELTVMTAAVTTTTTPSQTLNYSGANYVYADPSYPTGYYQVRLALTNSHHLDLV